MAQHDVEEAFKEHAKAIDTLHDKLKAHVEPGKEAELERHIDELRVAHKKLHDGAQEFMMY